MESKEMKYTRALNGMFNVNRINAEASKLNKQTLVFVLLHLYYTYSYLSIWLLHSNDTRKKLTSFIQPPFFFCF